MKLSQMIVAAAVAASGSAFASQTEFTAPDAGFRAAASRAEVRQELAGSYAAGNAAQQQRDGRDRAYTAQRSRQEVRSEMLQSQSRRGNVNDLYFGA
jgi:hypothetical protein